MQRIYLLLLLVSCDGFDKGEPLPPPLPEPPLPPPGSEVSFTDIQPILINNCALSGCHPTEPMFSSAEGLLESNSRARILNGTMPPRFSPKYNDFTPDKKAVVLEWFDAKL